MKIFKLSTKPSGKDRFEECREKNIITLGWGASGEVRGKSIEDIKEVIKEKYDLHGHSLGYAAGQVNTFVNVLKEEDIVIIKRDETIYSCIVGEYTYNSKANGYEHQRGCEWISVARLEDYTAPIQKLSKNRNAICMYRGEVSEYDKKLLLGEEKGNKTLNEKLRDKAVSTIKEAINHKDINIRIKAAELILKYDIEESASEIK